MENSIVVLLLTKLNTNVTSRTRKLHGYWDIYHPQMKFAKFMFLHVSVCPQGGWYPSMPCRWYPSMPCRSPGVCIPACLASFQANTQGGLEGSGQGGGVSRPTPRGVSPGPHPWGCIPACTEADTPTDGYCCGQYVSYWNAFFFKILWISFVSCVRSRLPPSVCTCLTTTKPGYIMFGWIPSWLDVVHSAISKIVTITRK